jgi:hypothetical protein
MECYFVECSLLNVILLSSVLLNVILLSISLPNDILLSITYWLSFFSA